MIKQILKIIWNQRRLNGWIFLELLVVVGILWYLSDIFFVNTTVYNQPLGYDIENCWRLKLASLNESAEKYIPVSEGSKADMETSNLLTLMSQIRLHPDVEDVCATFFSCPYSGGSSWSSVEPINGDTIGLSTRSFQARNVTPEYFNVFRVKDKYGNPITSEAFTSPFSVVITEDMEALFYGKETETRQTIRKLKGDDENPEIIVSAVSQPIRPNDYTPSEPAFYRIISGGFLTNFVGQFTPSAAELCVRMKNSKSDEDMTHFLESMSGRLTVNNLYVYGFISLEAMRENQIGKTERDEKTRMALMVFLLVNVLFGIVGTFWLRTQSRKGEIGIRVALGSDKKGLYKTIIMEGLCLLLLTLPFILAFISNLIYLDIIEQARLALTFQRLVIVFGFSYIIMAVMICIGIWIPARKAIGLAPAEALHYE